MTQNDKDWIVNTVCDFMIDAKEIHNHKKFSVIAYSNPEQHKIPV